jgi:hypothetical protein
MFDFFGGFFLALFFGSIYYLFAGIITIWFTDLYLKFHRGDDLIIACLFGFLSFLPVFYCTLQILKSKPKDPNNNSLYGASIALIGLLCLLIWVANWFTGISLYF